jgi:hypothetical protein
MSEPTDVLEKLAQAQAEERELVIEAINALDEYFAGGNAPKELADVWYSVRDFALRVAEG